MAAASLRERVVSEVGRVVVNKERETELLLAALLARGHVLWRGWGEGGWGRRLRGGGGGVVWEVVRDVSM